MDRQLKQTAFFAEALMSDTRSWEELTPEERKQRDDDEIEAGEILFVQMRSGNLCWSETPLPIILKQQAEQGRETAKRLAAENAKFLAALPVSSAVPVWAPNEQELEDWFTTVLPPTDWRR